MKKSIVILLAILTLITSIVYLYINNLTKIQKNAKKNNKEYEQYYEQEILGVTLISIINQAIDYNEKNNVQKQDKEYLNDNKNSIHIYVKFLESEKIIKMESIAEKQTENFVKYYATATFKCTKIEYHSKTHYIKNMYFEQIKK